MSHIAVENIQNVSGSFTLPVTSLGRIPDYGYSLSSMFGGDLNDAATVLNALGYACSLIIDTSAELTASASFNSGVALISTPGNEITLGSYNITINGFFHGGNYQVFNCSSTGRVSFGVGSVDFIKPEWWGADPTGSVSSLSAFDFAIDSLSSTGGTIKVSGHYVLPATWTVSNVSGLILKGTGSHLVAGTKRTEFDFTGLPDGDSGIVFDNCDGLTLEDFYSYVPLRTGGGAVIAINGTSGFSISRLNIESSMGSGSFGLKLGSDAVSASSVLAGTVKNCLIQNDGTPLLLGYGSTSVTLMNNYALGAGVYGFHIYHCNYCELNGCASDTGGASAWGYGIEASSQITIDSCGAENNGKGAFNVTGGSTGITFTNPMGVGNNTSADVSIGSLIDIGTSGINYDIIIQNPRDVAPDAATTASIYGRAGSLWTTVIGSLTRCAEGLDGDTTWKESYLTLISGEYPQFPAIYGTPTFYEGLEYSSGYGGGYKIQHAMATGTSTTGNPTFDIQVNIPAGARILGTQLYVTSVLSDNWDSAFINGNTAVISSNTSLLAGAVVNSIYDSFLASAIASAETDIRVTKNGGGNFSNNTGTIRAVVYYAVMSNMTF